MCCVAKKAGMSHCGYIDGKKHCIFTHAYIAPWYVLDKHEFFIIAPGHFCTSHYKIAICIREIQTLKVRLNYFALFCFVFLFAHFTNSV